jgi:hypothetical protein
MTDSYRVSAMAARFAENASTTPRRSLCITSIEVLEVSAAGLTLMSGKNSGSVCATDERAGHLEELQFSLGEGPCHDAYAGGAPIYEPDLEHAGTGRWPSFTPPALKSGTRGVFAFPIKAGIRCIGVLTLYQDSSGALTVDQTADGLVVAETLAEIMLKTQSRSGSTVLAKELSRVDAHRAEVHQASGMVSVQLGIRVADAELRLRAHAYATNTSVVAVAREIVNRELRLEDDRRAPSEDE